ncbi:MAG: hypothetical protein WC548_00210 [Candidatus Pacearchaeota archaeon]
MYTNESKLKRGGKQEMFTIPKQMLNEIKWQHKDLLAFSNFDDELISIEKVCDQKQLDEFKKNGGKYNSKYYKKISKLGGDSGTLGVKSFPKFLIDEFHPKNNQKIFFLPAKYTFLKEEFPLEKINNIVFMSFNSEFLKKLDPSAEKNNEAEWEEYRRRIIDKCTEKYRGENKEENNFKPYDFGLFHGSYDFTEKNSNRKKRKSLYFNKSLNNDKIDCFYENIRRFNKYMEYVKKSKNPRKKEAINNLKNMIKQTKDLIKNLEANPEKIFKEWPESELKIKGTKI